MPIGVMTEMNDVLVFGVIFVMLLVVVGGMTNFRHRPRRR